MKRKTLTVLSIALAVLVILSTIIWYAPNANPLADKDPLGLTAVADGNVQKITVVSGPDRKEKSLERQNNVWKYNDEEVNAENITSMLSSIKGAGQDLVSRKGRDNDKFGLNEFSAADVTFVMAGESVTYSVGRDDFRSNGTYVAKKDSNDTYLVRGTRLASFANADWSVWAVSTSTATSTSE